MLQEFKAAQNGKIEDYNANRIKRGEDPISFRLLSVDKVSNPTLEMQFALCEQRFKAAGRTGEELLQRFAFHGCSKQVIKNICDKGLLRVAHSSGLNPSKSTDDGVLALCGY